MGSSNYAEILKFAKRKQFLDDRGHRRKVDNRRKNKQARASRKANRG